VERNLLEQFHSILKKSIINDPILLIINYCLFQAKLNLNNQKSDRALIFYKLLQKISGDKKYITRQIEIIIAFYKKSTDSLSSLEIKCKNDSNESTDINEIKRFSQLRMMCLNRLGRAYLSSQDFPKSNNAFQEFRNIAARLSDLKAVSIAYNNLAILKTVEGKHETDPEVKERFFDEAIKLHEKQMDLCEKIGYNKGKQRVWGNGAIVRRLMGDIQQAKKDHKKELEYCIKMNYKVGLAPACGNNAIIQMLNGEDPSVYMMFQLIYAHEIKEDDSKAICYGNLALWNYHEGEYKKALLHNEMALRLSVNLNPDNPNVITLGTIGKTEGNIISSGNEESFEKPIVNEDKYPDIKKYYYLINNIKNLKTDKIEWDESKKLNELFMKLCQYDYWLLFRDKINFEVISNDQLKIIIKENNDTAKYEEIYKRAKNNKKFYLFAFSQEPESGYEFDERKPDMPDPDSNLDVFDDLTPAPYYA
jgi:hypothetical protein